MLEINLTILLAGVVAGAAPIVLAAVGETITEKAGLINLSLDGSILLSAMAAFVVAFETNSLMMGFVCGAIVGALVAATVAVFSIYLLQNQVAVGFVLTLMTRDLAYFIGNPHSRLQGPQVSPLPVPLFSKIPVLGDIIFNHSLPVYLSLFFIAICWWYIYHTPPRPEIKIRGRTPQGIICQRDQPPEAAVALCCLGWIIRRTGRRHVFTGHQARVGTASGGGRNRLDRTGLGDLRGLASG